MKSHSKFKASIKASGLTLKQAGELAELSIPTITERQETPMQFRLKELKGLYNGMDENGKLLLVEAVNEIFLP